MKENKKLKFTFLITNKEYGPKIVEYLKSKGIENYISFYGKGSASACAQDEKQSRFGRRARGW